MIRLFLTLIVLLGILVSPAMAQSVATPAQVDSTKSEITNDWRGRTTLRLEMSRGVPFRVFTLDAPPRLVMDFRGLDWSGVESEMLLGDDTNINGLRVGPFQPGWSRLVADLASPQLPKNINLAVEADTGAAILTLNLVPTAQNAYALASGMPQDALWPVALPETTLAPLEDDRFVVVIDPGHGGIDPGAERDGLSEKVLMLDVAMELRSVLKQRADVDVVLTRESDVFVSLQSRVAQAHRAGGDLFLSLHADALSQGGAEGATVYLLSDEASDTATAHLAARHNRGDIIAGVDLTGSDDQVTSVLLDLARQETEPRSDALARALIRAMDAAGGPMNNRPLRRAGFSVLKSADIPSALVEVGFLSSQRDLENLRDPQWRSKIVEAMAAGVLDWRDQDAAQRALVRQ